MFFCLFKMFAAVWLIFMAVLNIVGELVVLFIICIWKFLNLCFIFRLLVIILWCLINNLCNGIFIGYVFVYVL